MIVIIKTDKFQPNVASAMVICEFTSRINMEIETLSVFVVFLMVLWAVSMRMVIMNIEKTAGNIELTAN